MNSAKKYLYNTTILYFISNGIIALLQLFLLRYITGRISADGYGYYNLIISIDNILTPILTIQMGDAIFRFFFDAEDKDKSQIYTAGIIVLVVGIGLITIGSLAINWMIYPIRNVGLVIVMIASTNLFVVYQKIARSLHRNTDYVISNILRSVLYISLQVILLFAFNMGMESLFISSSISTIVSIIILEMRMHSLRYFRIRQFHKQTLINMITYSLPLVPNTLLWWLSSSVNAIIISIIIGLDGNGIYTVANKFAGILAMFTSVFLLAWQESAIREYGKDESLKYYNETFHMLCVSTFSAIMVIIPFIKVVLPYVIAESYYSAIPYAPILLLSSGLAVISGFFGSMYGATKRTKGAMTTTIYSVLVNLAIILLLINIIGIWAAAIAGIASNIVIVVVRYISFHKEMGLTLYSPQMGPVIGLIGISMISYYLGNYIYNIVWLSVTLILFVPLNWKLICEYYSVIHTRIFGGNNLK
jgi:O-antigen/teichoic acid export membrane protein